MPEITENIGWEKQIWDAAWISCSNLDLSEYKPVESEICASLKSIDYEEK